MLELLQRPTKFDTSHIMHIFDPSSFPQQYVHWTDGVIEISWENPLFPLTLGTFTGNTQLISSVREYLSHPSGITFPTGDTILWERREYITARDVAYAILRSVSSPGTFHNSKQ